MSTPAALGEQTAAFADLTKALIAEQTAAFADLAVIARDAMTQVDEWRAMPKRRRQRLLMHLACTGQRLPAITFPATLAPFVRRLVRAIQRCWSRLAASTLTDLHRTRARRSCEHTDASPAVLTSTLVHAPGAPALVA